MMPEGWWWLALTSVIAVAAILFSAATARMTGTTARHDAGTADVGPKGI